MFFLSEDHRLKSQKTVRELQTQSAAVLASCLAARTAVQVQSGSLPLVLPTLCQVQADDVRRSFFTEKSLTDLEHICESAVM
ncbi:hypothetical protein Q1695_005118 [Nippostrongylus brasiliensis]|nr:hypothetical protein Q1695_005118 [Nippostrongylus brasiliensis]